MAYISGTTLFTILDKSPWVCLGICVVLLIWELQANPKVDDTDDRYDPRPGTRYYWSRDRKENQYSLALRNPSEPPPTAEMLRHPDTEWYIDWDFINGDWDWQGGWHCAGLCWSDRDRPSRPGHRWYWKLTPQPPNTGGQKSSLKVIDQPEPNDEMKLEARLNTANRAPFPSWYLQAVPDRDPSRPWKWGDTWYRDVLLSKIRPRDSPPDWPLEDANLSTARAFVYGFAFVYFLVILADWIQGPYIYAVYKELGLSESRISNLLSLDAFTAIAFCMPIGYLTDRLGRKNMCLTFCFCYAIFSASILYSYCLKFGSVFPWGGMFLLAFGRVCRALAMILLYSAFDSWFLQKHDSIGIRRSRSRADPENLEWNTGRIFGFLHIIKAFAAFAAGPISEELIIFEHGKFNTVIASLSLFIIALMFISLWDENYGTRNPNPDWGSIFNSRVIGISSFSIFINISLDVFTLMWSRSIEHTVPGFVVLPYAQIYAVFLGCTVIGSLLFNLILSPLSTSTYEKTLPRLFGLAAPCLFLPLGSRFFIGEPSFLWNFGALCVFRVLAGAIIPTIGYLKWSFIHNENRAGAYAIINSPGYQWVVWALWPLWDQLLGSSSKLLADFTLFLAGLGLLLAIWIWTLCTRPDSSQKLRRLYKSLNNISQRYLYPRALSTGTSIWKFMYFVGVLLLTVFWTLARSPFGFYVFVRGRDVNVFWFPKPTARIDVDGELRGLVFSALETACVYAFQGMWVGSLCVAFPLYHSLHMLGHTEYAKELPMLATTKFLSFLWMVSSPLLNMATEKAFWVSLYFTESTEWISSTALETFVTCTSFTLQTIGSISGMGTRYWNAALPLITTSWNDIAAFLQHGSDFLTIAWDPIAEFLIPDDSIFAPIADKIGAAIGATKETATLYVASAVDNFEYLVDEISTGLEERNRQSPFRDFPEGSDELFEIGWSLWQNINDTAFKFLAFLLKEEGWKTLLTMKQWVGITVGSPVIVLILYLIPWSGIRNYISRIFFGIFVLIEYCKPNLAQFYTTISNWFEENYGDEWRQFARNVVKKYNDYVPTSVKGYLRDTWGLLKVILGAIILQFIWPILFLKGVRYLVRWVDRRNGAVINRLLRFLYRIHGKGVDLAYPLREGAVGPFPGRYADEGEEYDDGYQDED